MNDPRMFWRCRPGISLLECRAAISSLMFLSEWPDLNRLASRLVPLVRSLTASDRDVATVAISAAPRTPAVDFGIVTPTSTVVPVGHLAAETIRLTIQPQALPIGRPDDLPTVISAGVAKPPPFSPAARLAGPSPLVANPATGPTPVASPFVAQHGGSPTTTPLVALTAATPDPGWPTFMWYGGPGAGKAPPPSGGGPPPPGPPGVGANVPIVSTGTTKTTQTYVVNTLNDDVPVGAVLTFGLLVPTGKVASTITWSGGSNFWSYVAGDANQPAPDSEQVLTGPATTTGTYSFIVDANVRNYDVHVAVTYTAATGGGGGSCDVLFGSVRPSATISAAPPVPQVALDTNATNGKVDPGKIALDLSAPMYIEATSATNGFAGTFMFMQIVNSIRTQLTTDTGAVLHRANPGPLIDNGTEICYSYAIPPGTTYMPDWHLTTTFPNNVMPLAGNPPTMDDRPGTPVPLPYLALSRSDSFSTYVMFQPDAPFPGVWIAIVRLDWSWSGAATSDGAGNWTLISSASPAPGSVTPSGAAAFPGWVEWGQTYNNSPFVPGPLPN